MRCLTELGIQGAVLIFLLIAGVYLLLHRAGRLAQSIPDSEGEDIMLLLFGMTCATTTMLASSLTISCTYIEYYWWFLMLPVCIHRAVETLVAEYASKKPRNQTGGLHAIVSGGRRNSLSVVREFSAVVSAIPQRTCKGLSHDRTGIRPTGERVSRVAFVISQLRPGGAERVVVHLACELARRGMSPLVICLQEKGTLATLLEDNGVPIVALLSVPRDLMLWECCDWGVCCGSSARTSSMSTI